MKRYVVPAIELCGVIAAFYFGVQWYLNLQGNNEAAFALSGMVAALAEWFRRHLRTGVAAQEISAFIEQGQRLKRRKEENPLPINEHNVWVEAMETYFRKFGRADYVVRLSDFSGFTFYSDGSKKSEYSNAIDGRLRGLHEFLRELAVELK
jgi:hypothetical protein